MNEGKNVTVEERDGNFTLKFLKSLNFLGRRFSSKKNNQFLYVFLTDRLDGQFFCLITVVAI